MSVLCSVSPLPLHPGVRVSHLHAHELGIFDFRQATPECLVFVLFVCFVCLQQNKDGLSLNCIFLENKFQRHVCFIKTILLVLGWLPCSLSRQLGGEGEFSHSEKNIYSVPRWSVPQKSCLLGAGLTAQCLDPNFAGSHNS